MPIFCANKNKVFQRPKRLMNNQTNLLQGVTIESDWVKHLGAELKQHDSSVDWQHEINRHLSSDIAQSYIDNFKAIYARLKGRLDNKLPPLTSSVAQGITKYLIEGLRHCTRGILERAETLVASMQLPESIDDFLCLARTQLVEQIAYSGTAYKEHDNETRVNSNVHDKAIVFKWAQQAGFGIDTDNRHVNNVSIEHLRPSILHQIQELMERQYQYHDWPDWILQLFEEQHLSYKGYVGYKEDGYTQSEIEYFLEAISKLLQQDNTSDYLLTDELCTQVYDIDWALLRRKLWHKLINDQYVIKPEPDYTQLGVDPDTIIKAKYYFLALAKNDPERLVNYCNELYQSNYLHTIIKHSLEHLIEHSLSFLKMVLTQLQDLSCNSAHIGKASIQQLTEITRTLAIPTVYSPYLEHLLDAYKQFIGEDQLKVWLQENEWARLHSCLKTNADATHRFLGRHLDSAFNSQALLNNTNAPNNYSIWHLAVKYYPVAIIDALKQSSSHLPSLLSQDRYGETALHLATRQGNKQAFFKLLVNCSNKRDLLNIANKNKQTALHLAAQSGYQSLVRSILMYTIDIDAKDVNSKTPLHIAASRGQSEVIKVLLKNHASLFTRDNQQKTALQIACQAKQADAALTICDHIESSRDLETVTDNNMSDCYQLIIWTVANNKIKLFELMQDSKQLRSAINWNFLDKDDLACMHKAARDGFAQVIEKLIELKAAVNIKDGTGETPLHKAALKGHLTIINRLTQQLDIELNAATYHNKLTPLHYACLEGHSDIVEALHHQDSHLIEQANIDGLLSIHFAAKKGYLNIIQQLDGYDSQLLGTTTHNGEVIAHHASMEGYQTIIDYIYARDRSLLKSANLDGQTALHYVAFATEYNPTTAEQINQSKQTIINRLIDEVGLDINATDKQGDTALHKAVAAKQPAIARYLLERHQGHIDLNKRNQRGESPLLLTMQHGLSDIAQIMLDHGADPIDIDSQAQQHDPSGNVLHYLAHCGYAGLITRIISINKLDHNIINQANNRGQSPLLVATQLNQTEAITELLNNQADPIVGDDNNNTCLHYLLRHRDQYNIDQLLKIVDDVSLVTLSKIANGYNETPLHIAFNRDNISVFETLYERGNLPALAKTLYELAESLSSSNQPLIAWFMDNHCTEIMQMLLNQLDHDQVVNLLNHNLVDNPSHKVYHKIITQGSHTLCRWMIQASWFHQLNRQSITNQQQWRDTLVHCLVARRNDDQLIDLVEHYHSIAQTGRYNDLLNEQVYLINYAAQNPSQGSTLLPFLIQHYPHHINQFDSQGNTPLHHAIMTGNWQAVKVLLDNPQVDATLVNLAGTTIIDLARDQGNQAWADAIVHRAGQSVPIANINWQSSHIQQRQQKALAVTDKLHDQYIAYDKITTDAHHAQLAQRYFLQLVCHNISYLPDYCAKLQQHHALETTARSALEFMIDHQPHHLAIFIDHLQQQRLLDQLSGVLDTKQGQRMLNCIVTHRKNINLNTIISLITCDLLNEPIDHDKTLLDKAVLTNNEALLNQILAYDGVNIDLRRQFINIMNSAYEPRHLAPIMDKLCRAYQGHCAYQALLIEVLNEGMEYFDIAHALVSNSEDIDITDKQFLKNNKNWGQFLDYLAISGESKIFQMIANNEQMIRDTNWSPIRMKYKGTEYSDSIAHDAAKCDENTACEVIDWLITISRRRSMLSSSIMRQQLLYLSLNFAFLRPLSQAAINKDQGYNIVDTFIRREVFLDLENNKIWPVEEAAFVSNIGFLQRLIEWRGYKNAHPELDNQLREALFIGFQQGNTDIIELFETQGLLDKFVTSSDKQGQTALHWAALNTTRISPMGEDAPYSVNRKRDLIYKLVNQYKMPLDKKDKQSKTPMSIAYHMKSNAIIIFDELICFESYGFDLRQLGDYFRPLNTAAQLTESGAKGIKKWLARLPENRPSPADLEASFLLAAECNNQQAISYILDNYHANSYLFIQKVIQDSNQQKEYWYSPGVYGVKFLIKNNDNSNFEKLLNKTTPDQFRALLIERNMGNPPNLQSIIDQDGIELVDTLFQLGLQYDETLIEHLASLTTPQGEPALTWLIKHERHQKVHEIMSNVSPQIACDLLLKQNTYNGEYALDDVIKSGYFRQYGVASVDWIEALNYQMIKQSTKPAQTLGHYLTSRNHEETPYAIKAFIQAYEHANQLNHQIFRQANENKQLPLHVAASNHQQGDKLVAMLVQKYPADINQVNNQGLTPLHIAAESSNEPVIRILHACKHANINLQDNNGQTPQQIAISQGHFAIADQLDQVRSDDNLADNISQRFQELAGQPHYTSSVVNHHPNETIPASPQ